MAEEALSSMRSLALDPSMPARLKDVLIARATMQIEAFHRRLDATLSHQQQRFAELDWAAQGPQPSLTHTVDDFYAALNGMREDRLEYGVDQELAELVDRVEALQRDQQHQPGREQGMGY